MSAGSSRVQPGIPLRSVLVPLWMAVMAVGCESVSREPGPDATLPSSSDAAVAIPDAADASSPEPKLSASVVIDPGPDEGAEAYVCITTPLRDAGGVQIQRVTWFPPGAGVVLHHASLYAAAGELPDGALPCDPLPELVATLGIYTPGGEPLTLPADVAVVLPEQTSHLYFSAHVIRLARGPIVPTRVELGLATTPAAHSAQWVDIFADVPLVPPGEQRTAVGSCRFLNAANVVTVWGHMHRAGRRFLGTIVRANGERETLLEIPSWDFDHQLVHRVDALIEAGDSVETRCEWSNDGDQPIQAGSFTRDEMCNQGLFVWPPEGTHCVASP